MKKIKSFIIQFKLFSLLIGYFRTIKYDGRIANESRHYEKKIKELNIDSNIIKKLFYKNNIQINSKFLNIKNKKIKIFSVFSDKIWMEDAYLPALQKFGIVYHYDYKKYFNHTNKNFLFIREKMHNHLIEKLDKFFENWDGVKIFFGHLTAFEISPKTIELINKKKILTLNVNLCEEGFNGIKYLSQNTGIKELSNLFDLNWCYCDDVHVPKYIAENANIIYLGGGANPKIYKPLNIKKDIDVLFIGHKWNKRIHTVNFLQKNGVKIKVFGRDWGPDKFLDATKVNEYYNRSKIVLGSIGGHWPYSNILTDLKPRDFEIPMSGALYITLYNIELRDYYELGEEIICFYNNDDLLSLIKYYLNNEKEAEKIRIAAHKKAFANYKWEDRFQFIFKKLGIDI